MTQTIKMSEWWKAEDVENLQNLLDDSRCVCNQVMTQEGTIDFFAFGLDIPFFDREMIDILKNTPKQELEQIKKLAKLKSLKRQVEQLEIEVSGI